MSDSVPLNTARNQTKTTRTAMMMTVCLAGAFPPRAMAFLGVARTCGGLTRMLADRCGEVAR